MDVDIRHAEAEDGVALLELWHAYTAHLAEFDERYRHREEADDRWLRYFENQLVDAKYGTVVVADTGEDLVGALEARVTGGHPIFRLADHGSINGFFIRDGFRDGDVPRRLIEEAADWFRGTERGVTFCRVDVLDGDDAFVSDFRELGFTPVEHVYEKTFE